MKLPSKEVKPKPQKPTDEEFDNFHRYIDSIGLALVQVKVPANTVLSGIEINGKLLIIRASLTAFNKNKDVTWVYRKLS